MIADSTLTWVAHVARLIPNARFARGRVMRDRKCRIVVFVDEVGVRWRQEFMIDETEPSDVIVSYERSFGVTP